MRILVTGAGGGIGSAIVEECLRHDAEVVGQDLTVERLDARAERVAGSLLEERTLAEVRRIASEGLDAVVAAHGVAGSWPLTELTEEQVASTVAINFATVPRLFDAVGGALRDARGTYLVVASQAGLMGEANTTAYCASKFAAVGWTTGMAAAESASGTRFRALCPGPVETALLRGHFEQVGRAEGRAADEVLAERLRSVPAGRVAAPAELARIVWRVLSLQSPSPVVIPVTGGEVLN